MKKTTTLIFALVISLTTFAQQGINYKALIKDDLGNVVADQEITLQFSILDALSGGTILCQNIHNDVMTDANGIAIVNIGSGGLQSLSYGFFNDIDWGSQAHFLRVEIDITGGTNFTDMGTTEFMAVPYALSAGNVNGLQRITESNTSENEPIYGWRLKGFDPDLYAPIGRDAVDFSIIDSYPLQVGASGATSFAAGYYTNASGASSTSFGDFTVANGFASTAFGSDTVANGNYSFAAGNDSRAEGERSVAIGDYALAFGYGSFATNNGRSYGRLSAAIGYQTNAQSYSEIVVGLNNTNYTPTSAENFNSNDRLFVIGNGTNSANKNDALIIHKNGNAKFDAEIQHTSTGDANMIPIAYGSVNGSANPVIVGGTGNFSVSRNSTTNEYTINVTDQSLDLTNTVASVVSNTSNFRTVNVTYSGGNMLVHIFIANGTKVASPFQFTIYKL